MPGKKTQRSAVLVSVVETMDGVEIKLDDVKKSAPDTWKIHSHFTRKPYTDAEFSELNLSQEELAEFGFYILARLNASRKVERAKS